MGDDLLDLSVIIQERNAYDITPFGNAVIHYVGEPVSLLLCVEDGGYCSLRKGTSFFQDILYGPSHYLISRDTGILGISGVDINHPAFSVCNEKALVHMVYYFFKIDFLKRLDRYTHI